MALGLAQPDECPGPGWAATGQAGRAVYNTRLTDGI
ncbi:hypothetical protein SCOCK_210168 [Actinacidiphila cocklensis]|uniref:Uncharacterized protein n=1 Tax=Actinacidiphila cocklensis TaxID=887465 RepID=A0A9W4DPH3_9ACTN|nr:hypothetical protein SCOCK_210168 [Actinacidiphila cocklensis]